jgi:hypothetical protein
VSKQNIENSINDLLDNFKDSWCKATKQEIEDADGRKDRSNLISKKGSVFYVAYENENVLYVGESSVSVKNRFISDGGGSHREACSNWYTRMTHVKYVYSTLEDLPNMHRKLIEQALSICLSPEYYGSRT